MEGLIPITHGLSQWVKEPDSSDYIRQRKEQKRKVATFLIVNRITRIEVKPRNPNRPRNFTVTEFDLDKKWFKSESNIGNGLGTFSLEEVWNDFISKGGRFVFFTA